MRRYLLSLTVVLVLVLSAVIPVLAAAYTATISVTENGTAAYTMTGIVIPADNDWMADNGFFNSTANDTRVETVGGTEYPHMVADNATYTASAIPQGSQTNLYFTTGNTELDDFYIIPGNGGYVTRADNAALEISDNGSINMTNVYIDDDFLVYKKSAFIASGVGDNVTASLLSTTSITNGTNSGSVALYSGSNTRAGQAWASFPGVALTNFNVLTGKTGTPPGNVSVVVRNLTTDAVIGTLETKAASSVLNGGSTTFSGFVYIGYGIPVRVQMEYSNGDAGNYVSVFYRNSDAISGYWGYYDTEYHDTAGYDVTAVISYDAVSVMSSGECSGNNDISASANTTHWNLFIGGELETSTELSGASMADNANSWVFSMIYADSISIAVNGVTELLYDPTTIIVGTSLPDRSGNGLTGAFTFGSNPSGITVSLGSLMSDTQPIPAASTGDTIPNDILPASQVDPSGDIDTATLQDSILYDIFMVDPLSDLSGFSEAQLWRLYGFMFVLLATAGTAVMVRSHLVISGIACIGSMWYMYHLTIFPWWSLIISGVIFVTTLIMERQPSV